MLEKNPKTQLPNANSPELLFRLVDAVSRGIRTPRGLQENLGVELSSVHGYVHAGEWLGFLETHGDVWLTPLGLEFAFAGNKQNAVYARAVWANPFVRELMAEGESGVPSTEKLANQIVASKPDISIDDASAQARSIRNLIAPGLRRPPPKSPPKPDQLELPLGVIPSAILQVDLSQVSEHEFNPEIYRYFLSHLLDYGELSLSHVRGLLDAAQATETPLGGILSMSKARGDAHQVDERLITTAGAVIRQEVTRSVDSIILSDPEYRLYLNNLLECNTLTSQPILDGPSGRRFGQWHKRIFGGHKKPKAIRHRLSQLLLDRSLESFPIAGNTGAIPTLTQRPFLDVWEKPGLLICCPPSLKLVRGGLEVVNRLFRAARSGAVPVGIPDLTDRPLHFHGGLLHPGEPPPKNVPDTLSLRLRVLMNCPYLGLMTALLLAQRMAPNGPSLSLVSGRWTVRHGRLALGEVLPILDAFALEREWISCRSDSGALSAEDLLATLEALGIATRIQSSVVLAERFFARLRTDIEEMEVHRRLRPLAEVLLSWLKATDPISTMGSPFAS